MVIYASKSATRAANSAADGAAELAGVCANATVGVARARIAPLNDDTALRNVDLASFTLNAFLLEYEMPQ